MKKRSILIVDNEESICISLTMMMKKENYHVKSVSNSATALEHLRNFSCDVVLTDIMMDGMNGIQLLKNIKENFSQVKVLLMTGYANLESAIDALRLGASDYLVKPCSKKSILSSIQRCLESSDVSKKNRKINQNIESQLIALPFKEKLTNREKQVCSYLLSGLSNENIARLLSITIPTVKFHCKNIYEKIGVDGRKGMLKLMSEGRF